MSIFIDSSIFIAGKSKRDEKHETALTILKDIDAGKYGAPYTSDYVFDETTTYIMGRLKQPDIAVQTGEKLLETVDLWKVSEMDFNDAWALFKESRKLSFTDCTIMVQCRGKGVQNIATFDSGFVGKGFKIVASQESE